MRLCIFLTFVLVLLISKVSCSSLVPLPRRINKAVRLLRQRGEVGISEDEECDEWSENIARLEERFAFLEPQLNGTNQIENIEELERNLEKLAKDNDKLKEASRKIGEKYSKLSGRLKLLETKYLVKERRDCSDVREAGFTKSGVYNITVNEKVTPVYCDGIANGGDWMTIQRRSDGSQDFYVYWQSYVEGFGDLNREFWLGLENIHLITSSGSYQLRVNLEDWEGNTVFAEYRHFSVGDSSSNYRLRVSEYKGTAGESMIRYNNLPFTTRDRDNDQWPGNCAEDQKGAWWYQACSYSNLNGMYLRGGQIHRSGIAWWRLRRNWYSMKRAEMKIRRN